MPNKVTAEVKLVASAIVDDPVYRQNLYAAMIDRTGAPAIEQLLWFYAKRETQRDGRGRWIVLDSMTPGSGRRTWSARLTRRIWRSALRVGPSSAGIEVEGANLRQGKNSTAVPRLAKLARPCVVPPGTARRIMRVAC